MNNADFQQLRVFLNGIRGLQSRTEPFESESLFCLNVKRYFCCHKLLYTFVSEK